MNLKKSEVGLILILFASSLLGFLIKLPLVFRHHDRELHFLFYLLAALFFYIILGKNKLINHVIIFTFLLLFGIAIEFLQEKSNHFVNKKIHGNFDSIDIKFNFLGLFVASVFWGISISIKNRVNQQNKEKK